MGLWHSVPATLIVELAVFTVGVWLYARSTRAMDARGRWGFVLLVVFLLIIYFSSAFGNPPPNVHVIGWVGQAQWLLVIWGYWLDRHRVSGIGRPGETTRNSMDATRRADLPPEGRLAMRAPVPPAGIPVFRRERAYYPPLLIVMV